MRLLDPLIFQTVPFLVILLRQVLAEYGAVKPLAPHPVGLGSRVIGVINRLYRRVTMLAFLIKLL